VINLAVRPIPAGKCISVDVASSAVDGGANGVKCNSASDFTGGNESAFVNPANQTILAGLGGGTYTRLNEADYCNDNAFVKNSSTGSTCGSYGTQPPAPAQLTYNYTATCPVGYVAEWNLFTYSVQVPSVSDVYFTASTAPLLPDGGPGAFTSPVTLADPGGIATDPATCALSGSIWPDGGSAGSCAKYLGSVDGGPGLLGANARNPVLQLGITLTATSAIPTANWWNITYNCIPAE
jgi:hypothetical protein